MPGYDERGPMDAGARTGGGFGYGGPRRGEAETRSGGAGRPPRRGGRGMQRGFRRGFCFFSRRGEAGGYRSRRAAGSMPSTEARPRSLEAEAEELRRRLATIERQLAGEAPPAPDADRDV